MEEDGGRVKFDANADCGVPFGWVSKESVGGRKLLEEVVDQEVE